MKQVCEASPGKFASALLDILDESSSIEEPPSSVTLPMKCPTTPRKQDTQAATRKRPAAAVAKVSEEPPSKKAKTVKGESVKVQEKKVATDRRKDLKSIKLVMLKDMALRKGVEVSTKDKMIDGILAAEAK